MIYVSVLFKGTSPQHMYIFLHLLCYREFLAYNNELNIAMKPAAGLKPKKINNAEIGTNLRGIHLPDFTG